MKTQAIEKGPRHNGSWEGLAFSSNYDHLWVSMEEPLFEDGPKAGTGDSTAWVRIMQYDTESRKPVRQFAYQVDPVAYAPNPADAFRINGVVEILELNEHQLLVLERSFSTGRTGCLVKLYIADHRKATDISLISSLQHKTFKPAAKKLLLNMETLSMPIFNIEGITFGPVLNNGERTLIFVAYDNFSATDRTQFLFFTIEK